jgi:hypothetical protein
MRKGGPALNIPFEQGQLVATARAVLRAFEMFRKNDDHDAYQMHVEELKRLIGNAFQMRTELGDEIQLCHLILLMHGEQSVAGY